MDMALVGLALGGLATWFARQEDSIVDDFESATYAEFERTAETGDLLLLSSTEASSIIRPFTNSLWSHCGIVYRDRDTDGLYEWSAHREGECAMNSRGEFGSDGPQLVPLDYLAAMYGSVFWRKVEMSGEQRGAIDRAVGALAYKIRFSSAPEFLVYLGLPLFDGAGGGMACSHLVAASYAAAGVLELDRPLSRYTPKSFSEIGDALWTGKSNVGPVKMVLGYDATRLVDLSGQRRQAAKK